MFTFEIGGKAIAVTDASEDEAKRLLDGEEFRSDLARLESEDGPLWDGNAALTVRAATQAEIDEFNQVEDETEEFEDDDLEDEDGEEGESSVIVFLVPIIDTEEDEEN